VTGGDGFWGLKLRGATLTGRQGRQFESRSRVLSSFITQGGWHIPAGAAPAQLYTQKQFARFFKSLAPGRVARDSV